MGGTSVPWILFMSSSILFIRRSLGLNSVLFSFLASSCARLFILSILGVGVGFSAADLGLWGNLSVGIWRGTRVRGRLVSRCSGVVVGLRGSRELAYSGAGEGAGMSMGIRVGQDAVCGSGSGMLGRAL